MAEILLNGKPFPLRNDPPKVGRLLVLARAEKRGQQTQMAAYLDFIESMLAEHDPEEFEAAICEMDEKDIQAALEQAAESFKADPTSAGQASSSPSGPGSSTGAPTSRVVSFSRGTVEVQEAS